MKLLRIKLSELDYLKIVLAIVLLNLLYFIAISYKLRAFNSDSALLLSLATEIVRSRDFFPSDWAYFNNDIWIIFGHLLILPFVIMFGPSYSAYICGSLVGVLLLLQSVWIFCGILESSVKFRLIALIVVSSGVSLRTTENLFGHGAYGVVFFISVYLLYFSNICLSESGLRRVSGLIGLFTLMVFVAWGNPQRAVVFYLLPLGIGALAFVLVASRGTIPKSRMLSIIVLICVLGLSLVIGALLHHHTLKYIFMQPGYAYLNYDDVNNLLRNFGHVISFALRILGGEPVTGREVLTITGVYDALRLSFALVLLLIMAYVIIICMARLPTSSPRSALLWCFSVSAFFIIAFIQSITTTVRHSNYLTPAFLFLLLLTIHYLTLVHNRRLARVVTSVILVIFISQSFANNTNYWHNFSILAQGGGPRFDPHLLSSTDRLIYFLRKNDLTHGYAGFWYAGLLTALSDHQIVVRAIDFHDQLPVPRFWGAAVNWYQPNSLIEKSFILFPKGLESNIDVVKLEQFGLVVAETLEIDSYLIMVFRSDIASKLGFWEQKTVIRY